MESRSVGVDSIRMRWEEEGAGQPVIYLHGIPTSPRLWRHVIPRVQGARSLAWEMVGYGASILEAKGRDISVARQAEYCSAWMQAIGVERAVLVGHDLGGGVAQILAVHHPDRVAGLVLINSIAYDSWPIASVKMMRAMGTLVERLPDALFRRVFSTFIHRGHDNRSRARESAALHWSYYAAADGAAAFVRQIRALDAADTQAVADRLSQLTVPARLLWGTADQFQKVGYGYRLAHDLAAPLERIEGGKHFVPEDHPERVAAAINELLAESEVR
ncbi:MAG: alpha/beta fold hydrolase [Dehalococcoidia bacterium]